MIKLDLKKEPYWLDLPYGVSIRVKPVTTAFIMAARVQTLKDAAGSEDAAARSALLLKNLAVLVIEAWEGIGDDAGNIASVTPEAVKAFMDLWPMANAFEDLYLTPALTLEAEKNG
jgi:hypothetical protein